MTEFIVTTVLLVLVLIVAAAALLWVLAELPSFIKKKKEKGNEAN